MEKWEIWDAIVAYEEDGNQTEIIPVLVYEVKDDNNIIAFKMTSHEKRNDRECEVRKWKEAGLDKETVIRTDKVLRLKKANFQNKRGKLQFVDIFRFDSCRTNY